MNGVEMLDHLVGVGGAVWRASWQASVLAAMVMAVQLAFGKHLPARWRHAMWMLVLVRLALPVAPSSPVSVFNLAPAPAPAHAPLGVVVQAPVEIAGISIERETPVDGNAPHAPSPEVAPDLWTRWPQVLAILWALGASLLALRIAWATWHVWRTLRRLDRVDDAAIQDILRAAATELGVHRLPRLLAGDGLFSPALVGVIRPRLLVPRDLLASFDPAELRLIFLHELAHLKRRDVAINWAATVLAVVHWLNPVVWLVLWRLRIERELACDELVMSRTSDTDRRAYGHTIVKLLETFSRGQGNHPALPAGGVGILEGKAQMKRRITMIAQFAKSSRTWTVAAVSIVLTLGLVALTDAVAAEEQPAERRPVPAARQQEVIETGDGKRVSTNNYVPAEQTDATGDAKIKIGELITVSVMHIAGEGIETMKTARVDADGKLRLPLGHVVKAAGLTPAQLEREVAKPWGDSRFMSSVSLPDRGESHQLARRPAGGGVPGMAGAIVAEGMGIDEAMMAEGRGLDPAMMGIGDPATGMYAAQEDPATKELLGRKLPEVKFDQIPLGDVVDFFRDALGVNVFVNWRALEAAGIGRDEPVSMRLKDVALRDVLSLLMRGVGQGAMTYKVENGVIVIDAQQTQPVAKQAKLVTEAYDVAHLLGSGTDEQLKSKLVELQRVIMSNVQPQTWGNRSAGVSTFDLRLIITAPEEVHRDVKELLKMLARHGGDTPATQPRGDLH
ncbi:MAG TPA: M56 family metallopeptidase [Tepidisphaeraceae bacterium]|nr:M56 family metallopeptidase [Tepidisphaeraceae bacterium]